MRNLICSTYRREIVENQPLISNPSTCFDLAPFFALTGTLTSSIFKTPYRAVLRPDLENKPNTVSTRQPYLENLQSSFVRDTKVVFWRRPSRNRPEQAPDRETVRGVQYCCFAVLECSSKAGSPKP